MKLSRVLGIFRPRSSHRRVTIARGSGVPPAMTSSFRLSAYPRSTMAAAAVTLFGVLLVLVNLPLASCESFGGGGGGGGVSSQNRPATADGTLPPGAASPVGIASTVNLAPLDDLHGEPEMRVRVSEAATTITIAPATPHGQVLAGPLAAGLVDWVEQPSAVARPLRLDGKTTIALADGRWTLTDERGRAYSLAAASDLGLVPDDGGMVLVDGSPYAGRVRLMPRSDLGATQFDAVEFVRLETYLPGVIAKELYNGWPLETYRVQAVCARSYALHERARSRAIGRWFDVQANQRNQAYIGVTQNRTAAAAVASTRGVVLGWQGHVLRAYYSSTCGGRAASAADTWPTSRGFEYNLPEPLQVAPPSQPPREHACQNAPLYRWTVTRNTPDLAARLRAFGESKLYMVRRLKGLAAITPKDFNADGRPRTYKIVEPGGTWYELTAEDLRVACNTPAPAAGLMTHADRDDRVNSSDLAFAFVGGPNGTVTISGRGFGHGVGMCQYCALEMAKRGDSWKTMLARFYPRADIVRAYE